VAIHGLALGKFLPPHLGHVHLCEVAERMCDELTIVVASLASEPIAGALRVAWMRELFPRASVVHHTAELPQSPAEHPEFWRLWADSVRVCAGAQVHRVFGADRAGRALATELGATWIPVDPDCSVPPISSGAISSGAISSGAISSGAISSGAIRREPIRYFEALPRCVRPHFVRRVSVFGPSSSGKSTLAAELARACATVCVPEFARAYLEGRGATLARADIDVIGEGQIALEDALARDANRVLICDTDPMLAVVWAEVLFGDAPGWLRDAARVRRYDLTLLCDPDLPWSGDPVRYQPGEGDRAEFFARCQRALRDAGRRYERIRGTGAARAEAARAVVRTLGGTLKEDQG
jgi:cytidyltransferase-like protein